MALAPLFKGQTWLKAAAWPPWFAPSLPPSLLIWASVLRRGKDGDFPKHVYYFVSIFGPPGCHAFNFKAPLDPVFSWLLRNKAGTLELPLGSSPTTYSWLHLQPLIRGAQNDASLLPLSGIRA